MGEFPDHHKIVEDRTQSGYLRLTCTNETCNGHSIIRYTWLSDTLWKKAVEGFKSIHKQTVHTNEGE
jgi:hypothetical protein